MHENYKKEFHHATIERRQAGRYIRVVEYEVQLLLRRLPGKEIRRDEGEEAPIGRR